MSAAAGEPATGFGARGESYAAGRPDYPESFWADVLARAPGREQAADMGAGTGQATRRLLQEFAHVHAVEPDPAMAARLPKAGSLTVHNDRFESVTLPRDDFDAVVCATAFHWTDRGVAAGRARDWLRPGGVFAVIANGGVSFPDNAELDAVFKADYEKWRAYRSPRIEPWQHPGEQVSETGVFNDVETRDYPTEMTWPGERIVAYIRSTSFASAYAEAEMGLEAYDAWWSETLARLAPEGAVIRFHFQAGLASG